MVGPAPWKQRVIGSSASMIADADEVRRALELFADPEGWCQVVAIPTMFARTGNEPSQLARTVADLPGGCGIYFQINPVREGLKTKAKKTDITKRRWLFIDIDPVKDEEHGHNPATDKEKGRAGNVCDSVNEYLRGLGWPAPIVTDSGNGCGMFWRCDLPNDELTRSLYKRLLAKLAERFDGENGRIDKAVHNADRLAKLPGTWARKGTQSDDRPFRPCKLVYVPSGPELVSLELLKAAAELEDEPEQKQEPGQNGHVDAFTVRTTTGDGHKAYAKAALDKECVRVVLSRSPSMGGEGRNNTLNKAAFNLGTLLGAGLLDRAQVENELYRSACACGLDTDPECGEHGIRSTIQSGLAAGMAKPRNLEDKDRSSQTPAAPTNSPTTGQVIYWASSVKPRAVEWLWPGRIPLGKLTTFAGNGGLGKTFVLCDIIARITQGMDWPCSNGECSPVGKCLFISGEDDPEDTLVPRMIELGADLNRVAFLQTAVLDRFTLADLKTLDTALDQMGGDVRFVGIDPPTAYLGGVNDHKNAELRGLLTPLMSWAMKRRLAIVFNTHVNKPQGAKVEAMMRVMGSVAWVNAMRSAYMFAKDPDNHEQRLFVGMKTNLGGERKGLAYKIAATSTLARVEWLGEVDTSADDAANNQRSERKRSIPAAAWLAELFADTDKIPSDAIWRAKRQTTISDNALKEAKDEMGIRAKQEHDGDGNRAWFWMWPKERREGWLASQKTDPEDRPIP